MDRLFLLQASARIPSSTVVVGHSADLLHAECDKQRLKHEKNSLGMFLVPLSMKISG